MMMPLARRAFRSRPVGLLTLVLSMVLASAVQAHGPTRQKVSESIDIDASPDAVWALVGDFAGASAWLPMVSSSSGEGGNEPGAKRTLVLGEGVEIHEVLKKYDAGKRTLSYRIPDSTHDVAILPVNNYSSSVTVTANGDGSTVTWKGAFYRGYPNNDPPEELNDEAAVAAVTGVYQAGLAELKKLAEGG